MGTDRLEQVGNFVRTAMNIKKGYYIRFTIKNERKHMKKPEVGWVDPKEYKVDESQEIKDDFAEQISLDESIRDDKDLTLTDVLRNLLEKYGTEDDKGDRRLSYDVTLLDAELVPQRKMVNHIFLKDVDQNFKDKFTAFMTKIKSYRVPDQETKYYDTIIDIPPRKDVSEHICVIAGEEFVDEIMKQEAKIDKIFIKTTNTKRKELRTHPKVKVVDPVMEKVFAARFWDFQFDIFPPPKK